jgi:hypothetical protein
MTLSTKSRDHYYMKSAQKLRPEGAGCGPKVNLLQDTPGYCVDRVPGACPTVSNPNGGAAKDRDYTNYHIVKTAYDQLNYDLLMQSL